MSSPRAIGFLSALFAWGTLACGEPQPVAEGVRRVRLRPISAAEVGRQHKLGAHIEVPAELGDWRVRGADVACVEGSSSHRLRLTHAEGAAFTQVGIPGHYPQRSADRFVVRLSSSETVMMRALLKRRGEVRVRSTFAVRVVGGPAPTTCVLDLPRTHAESEPFDEIALRFLGLSGEVVLHSIDLMHVPLAGTLPDPEQEPGLITIGDERRSGIGLSSHLPLHAKLGFDPGETLSFSYAIPDDLIPRRMAPRLEVELRDSHGGRELHRFGFGDLARPAEWREARLPLAALRGDELQVELRIVPKREGADPERELVCAVAEARLARPAPSSGAPTVLLVTVDTLRADHVRASQLGVDVQSPLLDSLTERGVSFSDCYSTTNVTIPSHVAIMTGTSPRDTRVIANNHNLSADAPTLAESFRDAGWLTWSVVGVRNLGVVERGLGQGFDRIGVTGEIRSAGDAVTTLERWLPTAASSPLFVWLHLFDAHAPYEPPEAFAQLYRPPVRDPFDPRLPSPAVPDDVVPLWLAGLRDLDYPARLYRGEVSYLDSELGRLFRLPRFAESITCVTADHGECLGEHDVYWQHVGLLPQNLHVPLILAWPGSPRGERVGEAVQNQSVGRTLLDLAGLTHVPFAGRNLLESRPSGARFAIASDATAASITEDGWHLILCLREHFMTSSQEIEPRVPHQLEIYRLADEPTGVDRLRTEGERARRMRAKLVAWLMETEGSGWLSGETRDSETLRELAQLGYATAPVSREPREWFDPNCRCEFCAEFGPTR